MNILSVGHRLLILKGVYDIKIRQGIPIDPDLWVPLCKSQDAWSSAQSMTDYGSRRG